MSINYSINSRRQRAKDNKYRQAKTINIAKPATIDIGKLADNKYWKTIILISGLHCRYYSCLFSKVRVYVYVQCTAYTYTKQLTIL